MNNSDKQIEVCGTCCPVPLIQVAKAMAPMKKGEIIEVTGDDPIFELGIRDFCSANSHEILNVEEIDRFKKRIWILCAGEEET